MISQDLIYQVMQYYHLEHDPTHWQLVQDLVDALQEWFDVIQPKYLQDNETGLTRLKP